MKQLFYMKMNKLLAILLLSLAATLQANEFTLKGFYTSMTELQFQQEVTKYNAEATCQEKEHGRLCTAENVTVFSGSSKVSAGIFKGKVAFVSFIESKKTSEELLKILKGQYGEPDKVAFFTRWNKGGEQLSGVPMPPKGYFIQIVDKKLNNERKKLAEAVHGEPDINCDVVTSTAKAVFSLRQLSTPVKNALLTAGTTGNKLGEKMVFDIYGKPKFNAGTTFKELYKYRYENASNEFANKYYMECVKLNNAKK